MITIQDIKQNDEIKALIEQGDKQLELRGYTEHNLRHVALVSKNAGNILKYLGHDEREAELARIAGFMHDIGNAVNREHHENSGALLSYFILTKMGMDIREAAQIMSAIGNHDEGSGAPVSNISAALILADKSDVHRSRVRNSEPVSFDIHDRVNYAVYSSSIRVEDKKAILILQLVLLWIILKYFWVECRYVGELLNF